MPKLVDRFAVFGARDQNSALILVDDLERFADLFQRETLKRHFLHKIPAVERRIVFQHIQQAVEVIPNRVGRIQIAARIENGLRGADVLPDVAEYPLKEMSTLSRKAKWRAGEIKFLDFLLAKKEKKQAAYDSRDINRKWYHRLYTLAHSKGSKSIAGKITGKSTKDGLIPNATIVITKADVDMIKAEKNIDLLKASTAKAFCNELFLMAFIVIDVDAQSIKLLLPDINNGFEVQSLAAVQKQIATLDTSGTVSREVSRMMNGR